MRGMHARAITTLAAAFLLVVVLGGGLEAQSSLNVWSTYHYDGMRQGQNPYSQDIVNPASIGLVWVFPRDSATVVDEATAIVDDLQDPKLFTLHPRWQSDMSSEAYASHYWYTNAVSRDSVAAGTATAIDARWDVPPLGTGQGQLPPGNYQIAVWAPPRRADSGVETNTTQAVYEVWDDGGVTPIVFNQQGAGYWKLLSTRYFRFTGTGSNKTLRVVLTNATYDSQTAIDQAAAAGRSITVVADAIRFIPATGQEIYASPASAELMWTTTERDPTNPSQPLYNGLAPFVFIGTVEQPLLHNEESADTGAVYAVNSVTPTKNALSALSPDSDDYKKFQKLSEYLGTPLWRYPNDVNPNARDQLEGPIEGGIYSSPTLAYVGDPLDPTKKTLVCFVAAMDRQVYAIEAATGRLIWKGPGVTLGEKEAIREGAWNTHDLRPDAFGGSFDWAQCSSTQSAKMTWNFTDDLRKQGGEPTTASSGNVPGWSYSVYAWVPVHVGSDMNGKARVSDAVYTITYLGEGGGETTATVRVDQASLANQGRWVKLGGSYFNVRSVSLSNVTSAQVVAPVPPGDIPPGDEPPPPAPAQPAGSPTAQGGDPSAFGVVADAVMIVPESIGEFSYSTVVTDAPSIDGNANNVYVANTDGRILSFDVRTQLLASRIARVKWIYPRVRSTLVITASEGYDDRALGEVGASLTFFRGSDGGPRLIAATYSGNEGSVICLRNINDPVAPPAVDWQFPNAKDEENDQIPTGFTSSPTVDIAYRQVFVASTSGVLYCLSTDSRGAGNSQLKWRYPQTDSIFGPTGPGMPGLGAFRYSTPAVANDDRGVHRVWVGSSDGRLYSFIATETAPPQGRRLGVTDDGDPYVPGNWYAEPSVGAPIQASLALDNKTAGKRTVMYVGDMKGSLSWYDATTGASDWYSGGKNYKSWRTEGELFSSPNVTHTETRPTGAVKVSWLYTGCSDGRLYAFSHGQGAWGGQWSGGRWPFEGEPGGESQKEETLAPNTQIQFDIFPRGFHQNSSTRDPDPRSGTKYTMWPSGTWPDDWIVGADMKLVKKSEIKDEDGDGDSGTDKDIDELLRRKALLRRGERNRPDYVFAKDARADGTNDVYFEWGEQMYLVMWNLPGMEYLYGSDATSRRNNIRFIFTNASAGESAGSRLTLAGDRKILKEYTVIDEDTRDSQTTPDTYEALKYATGKEVKRSYLLAQIDIRGTSSRPPSPGAGWELYAEIRRKESTAANAPIIPETIPLARLEWKRVDGKTVAVPKLRPLVEGADPDDKIRGQWDYTRQPLGINNPLAIAVKDRSGYIVDRIAWGGVGQSPGPPCRYLPDAHINGNPPGKRGRAAPLLDLGVVPHGTSSVEVELGVMDRSAVGCNITKVNEGAPPDTQSLQRFRINASDLRWRGGDDAIRSQFGGMTFGIKLPWEMGHESIDYPNIYRSRQSYRKLYDDTDPSRSASMLPPLLLKFDPNVGDWNTQYPDDPTCVGDTYDPRSVDPQLRPDSVMVSVAVPRYQPANTVGYTRTVQAFIDSDGDRNWDTGTTIRGRPSTYQEAYREFRVGLVVPPDPRIEVEEQLVDLGPSPAPHGLGDAMGTPSFFDPYNVHPDVQRWFKRVTIKNAGNVNLYNLRIGGLDLFSDQASPAAPLPGSSIISSLDPDVWPQFASEPFITVAAGQGSLGHTLTKSRVGDPDPSVLTIPDRRKWDTNYGFARTQAAAVLSDPANPWPADQPLPVKVSVRVPLTQPVGVYGTWDPQTKMPLSVPVYAEMSAGSRAFADPSFQLKVTVRESQLTGGVTPTTLPQIDVPTDEPMPRVGDASPAAFRDVADGAVHLFWSSNRMYDPNLYPTWPDPSDSRHSEFAGAPWLINRATLVWDDLTGWKLGGSSNSPQWWHLPTSNQFLPQFTGAGGNSQWPPPLTAQADPGASVAKWKFGNVQTDFDSVRHHSPTIAENLERIAEDPTADTGLTWLAWAGAADIQSTSSGKTQQEHLIFYTDATHGRVTQDGGAQVKVHAIEHDPSMVKRSPSFAVYKSGNQDRMWAFWQGGSGGKWSIYYSTNFDTTARHDPAVTPWSAEVQLRTPDCLSSVSSPSALRRILWESRISGAQYNNPNDLFDVVYAGTSKLTQNADIMLGRYLADANARSSFSPGQRALPMPRVFAERLVRDPKFGFFTSRHLAWMRLDRAAVARGEQVPVIDKWGVYDPTVPREHPDMPYVHVVLPGGYTVTEGTATRTLRAGSVVSATDGSIYEPDERNPSLMIEIVPPAPIMPAIDDATGIYTYTYPREATRSILGEMLVDFSAGIVRFTKPLPEVRNPDGTVSVPRVFADYTPQTWRLTTDAAIDSSPRAFIERTPMTPESNPGMSSVGGPVDRMWVFWRKAGSGVNTSTIYYSTYRVGVDISKLRAPDGSAYPPIPIDSQGRASTLTVSGNLGPWEVDGAGRKVYFSEVDERYRSLETAAGGVLGAGPGPIRLAYKVGDVNYEIIVHDAFWIEELPEQSLFGFASDGDVNEGGIYAFADPDPKARTASGTFHSVPASKIWVFWTSTRGGTSDLFWETLSPDFAARR